MILDVDLETWKEFRFSEPLQLFCEHRRSGLVVSDKEIKNVNGGYSYMIIKTKWSVSEALRKLQGTLRATPCFKSMCQHLLNPFLFYVTVALLLKNSQTTLD